MFKKPLSLLALLFAVALVAAACVDDEESTEAESGSASASASASVADDEAMEDEAMEDEAMEDESMEDESMEDEAMDDMGTIVDVAVASGEFPTLVAALQAAELDGVLAGEGPFTVFAPTEDAFAAALDALGLTADELLASDDLAGILTYHVLPLEAKAETVLTLDGQEAETVNGATVAITIDGDTVMVNEANVVQTDIVGSNGVIHVIDSVLLPPAG
ncbi:MAG: fasciclin domain-containing protein [Actinomycetota bacterium]